MQWTEPSLGMTISFSLIVLAVVVMFRLALVRAAPERANAVTIALLAWMAVTAGLAGSGALGRAADVAFLPFLGMSNLLAIGLALSPVGRKLAVGLPLVALVGFHAFRLPLELVLHQLVAEGVIPRQMSWESRNIDVITGILAAGAVPVLLSESLRRWHKPVAWVVAVVGFALLLNVGVTAVLCSPVPMRRYMDGPALQLAFHVPWVWIVPVCVAGAMAGHVVLFRSLLHPAARAREVPV